MHDVLLERAAERDLKALPRAVFDRIITQLKALAHNPRPTGCRKIVGSQNDWRVRIGDYRIVYQVDDQANSATMTRAGLFFAAAVIDKHFDVSRILQCVDVTRERVRY